MDHRLRRCWSDYSKFPLCFHPGFLYTSSEHDNFMYLERALMVSGVFPRNLRDELWTSAIAWDSNIECLLSCVSTRGRTLPGLIWQPYLTSIFSWCGNWGRWSGGSELWDRTSVPEGVFLFSGLKTLAVSTTKLLSFSHWVALRGIRNLSVFHMWGAGIA